MTVTKEWALEHPKLWTVLREFGSPASVSYWWANGDMTREEVVEATGYDDLPADWDWDDYEDGEEAMS